MKRSHAAASFSPSSSSSKSKHDKKMVERNRRIQMKSLFSTLVSLVPASSNTNNKNMMMTSQQDQLSHVISYINDLKQRIKDLEIRKKQALDAAAAADDDDDDDSSDMIMLCSSKMAEEAEKLQPVVELRDFGFGNSVIELIVISNLNKNFMLHEIINVVEEEGGQVLSASFFTMGNQTFHSLHVEAKILRVGIETTRLRKRLQKLVYS